MLIVDILAFSLVAVGIVTLAVRHRLSLQGAQASPETDASDEVLEHEIEAIEPRPRPSGVRILVGDEAIRDALRRAAANEEAIAAEAARRANRYASLVANAQTLRRASRAS